MAELTATSPELETAAPPSDTLSDKSPAPVSSSAPLSTLSSLSGWFMNNRDWVGEHGAARVPLYRTDKERETLTHMADLFAIIQCVERLESAWRANTISDADYERACGPLITRFRATRQLLADEVPSVISFAEEYHMSARAAVNRLQVGVPATVEHANGSERAHAEEVRRDNFTAAAIRATEAFLTVQDALELGERNVDALLPYLRDLLHVLSSRISTMFEATDGDALQKRERIVQWVRRLDGMRASDKITEEDKRQLSHDLQGLYEAFKRRVGELEM